MFKLLRYFSLTSAVAIIVATGGLTILHWHHAIDQIVVVAEKENISLARTFANSLGPRLRRFVAVGEGLDAEALRARQEALGIHDTLASLARGLPVLKVKIYDLDGTTMYSSESSEIGADKSGSPGFVIAAREARPASKLTFKDTLNSFEGVVASRDIVESYVPIRRDDQSVEGVFELYADVTDVVRMSKRATVEMVLALAGGLGLLYGVLFVIVRRADRILRRQYADLLDHDEIIKAKNAMLERQVAERRLAEEAEREAKEEAVCANRAKTEFLANMSHELRTPLNAVIGFSDIIRNGTFGPVGDSRYLEYAVDINESGQHLLKLINDILDLSKIETGRLELRETEVDVTALATHCLNLVKGRADAGGHRFTLELEDGLPPIRADERRLKQILLNLLSNALKFTPEGGTISLGGSLRSDGAVALSVADTGVGMAAEDIPGALAPFSQLDGSLARAKVGSGLGLPTAKALVELHGGSLEIRSQPGVGTTVTVIFPAGRRLAGAAPVAARAGR